MSWAQVPPEAAALRFVLLCMYCCFIFLKCLSLFLHLYPLPTGRAGWGIAWYINGTLIPELVVQRGQTYTFIVYGGDNEGNSAQYHPFYITDSVNGGRLLNTKEQNQVNVYPYATCILSAYKDMTVLRHLQKANSYFRRKMSCLGWNLNPQHSAIYVYIHVGTCI